MRRGACLPLDRSSTPPHLYQLMRVGLLRDQGDQMLDLQEIRDMLLFTRVSYVLWYHEVVTFFYQLWEPDPYFFGPPRSGSISQRVRLRILNFSRKGAKQCCKIKFEHNILAKKFIKLKIMCLWVSYKKNMKKKKILFASLKSLKKGVRSGVGSGSRSISQRYGSADPDPHQCHGSPTLLANQFYPKNLV